MGIQTKYFLGRVLKQGEMTTDKVIQAMRDPVDLEYRGTKYSFIDFEVIEQSGREVGYFAKIAKYKQDGAVDVVHEARHASGEASVLNLIDASSPFVYIPSFSGIAYRHIWNKFSQHQFERVFKELVESRHQKFFVGCDIEAIADLRTFARRLSKLDQMNEIKATVSPPNPLFGPCWKSLSEYLKTRKLNEVSITEQSKLGIDTKLKEIAEAILLGRDAKSMVALMEPLLSGVGDAALLMAADGYGHARVKGVEDGKMVTINTSENQKNFSFDSNPNPKLLYEIAADIFKKISLENGLEHP